MNEVTFIFDVYDIQLQLERLIFQKCNQDEMHFHRLNIDNRMTFHETIKWWLLDRLDRICLFPVVNHNAHQINDDMKAYLWDVAHDLESVLWKTTRPALLYRPDLEWVRAVVEVRDRSIIVNIAGNAIKR